MRPSDASAPRSAPESTTDEDAGFWFLLSGKEVARPSHPAPDGRRARVVLLHGWLMDHSCWLRTAAALRDRYGHDVLLLDFHGHGRSPLLPHFSEHTPERCVAQLRAALRAIGWISDADDAAHDAGARDAATSSPPPSLVLCGLSLGGVVSCLYADAHPRDVARVILVSSPGAPERWWMPPNLTRPLRLAALSAGAALDRNMGALGRWVTRTFPPTRAFLSHASLVRDTPTFGVPEDMPARLKRLRVPLVLVWGALDQFHTPQIRRWKAGRPHRADVVARRKRRQGEGEEGEEGEDEGVQILIAPYFDHFAACMFLDRLRLAERAHFWHDAPPPPPRRRAKL